MARNHAIDTPLRRWRLTRGITQADAAERAGITQRIWSRYERGERIATLRGPLRRLMTLTGLSFDALLDPERYLEMHPAFLREGAVPLSGPGWPLGRKRS
jgi:transcriptional regulator with XRE-family HTH domain